MTKDQVLMHLKKASGYLSGEEISQKIGVTRAAVSEAVKALRKAGYVIDSATRKGYLLRESPNVLSLAEMTPYLPEERLSRILVLEKTGSTNSDLKGMADEGAPEGQVIIANEQTEGRGRRGRSFLSLKDKGIYFSYLLRPDCRPEDVISITAWTAVAIARAVKKVCGIRPDIKWVNDLQIDGRKICGILSEMWMESESAHIKYIIVGIGINVNQSPEDFPEDLRETAGSIAMGHGKHLSRSHLAAEMVREMDALAASWPKGKEKYFKTYRSYCITEDRDIAVITPKETKKAHAICVNPDFTLKVSYEDGSVEDLSSGEVSTRL